MKLDIVFNSNTIIIIVLVGLFALTRKAKEEVEVIQHKKEEVIKTIKKKKNEVNNFKIDDSAYFADRDSLRAINNPL